MARPKNEDTVETKEETVNQPANAPIAPSDFKGPVSLETLSHQWQENSPAINTNAAAGYNAPNLVALAEAAKEEAKEEKAEKLSEAEYERRTKLDVSNPQYINPSLDHKKVK